VELASFFWEEQYSPGLLPKLHSMVVYPQCSFAFFLMDPNTQVGNSRIFSLNIETGELSYQTLMPMSEEIQGIHLTRGGLQGKGLSFRISLLFCLLLFFCTHPLLVTRYLFLLSCLFYRVHLGNRLCWKLRRHHHKRVCIHSYSSGQSRNRRDVL
jgi:hypothetical protein